MMILSPSLLPFTAATTQKAAREEGFVTIRRGRFVFTVHTEYIESIISDSVLTEPIERLISRHDTHIEGGRGAVARVDIPGIGAAFVRDYRHGGLLRALLGGRFFVPGRETRELRVLQAARVAGLPVPDPLASARERCGFLQGYRARIVTAEIPRTASLVTALWEKTDRGRDTSSLLFSVGKTVRALHNTGIFHHDLNMHNILVDENDGIFIIDFDRARLRKALGMRGRIANLRRLLRSGRKLARLHHNAPKGWFSDDRFRELLKGYVDGDEKLKGRLISKTTDFFPLIVRARIGWALDDLLYRRGEK
ncbi:MAG: phosphotransferase [Deltaproteobacteria bacterium]|nr:phosphotransferase [Candidatus Zymogenaceae bacterium]